MNPMINKVALWLVIIGGLNWLIAGIGSVANQPSIENGIVATALGTVAGGLIAAIVYILVGLGALVVLLNQFKSSQ